MSKLIEPIIKEIDLEGCSLKRLKYHPEYNDDFVSSVANDISTLYDETTIAYAKRLIEIDCNGLDDVGYFTLGKDIWIILEKETNKLVGYEVITRKRGGSIKLGPTYIKSEFRGKGFASKCDLALFDLYANSGARKVYLTAPITDLSSAKLDFKKLGLKLEAVLHKHYSTNFSERICGKFLNNELNTNEMLDIETVKTGERIIDKITLNEIDDKYLASLTELIVKNMSENYDDIDENFAVNLINHAKANNNVSFENKDKDFYIFYEDNKFAGLCVATSKRGGAYKVIPFILNEDFVNSVNIEKILGEIEQHAKVLNRKKVTIFVPVQRFSLLSMFSNFCVSEGVLKAPYKKNQDIAIMSKFLEVQNGK